MSSRESCWITDGGYRPSKAIYRNRNRRSQSRRHPHYTENDFAIVRRFLRKQWSPGQIVGIIRRFKPMKRRMRHETIYQYSWRDKAAGGQLWRHPRQPGKHRGKRYNACDSRGRLAWKRPIPERPKMVETRRTRQHIEIDTVVGEGSKIVLPRWSDGSRVM